MNATFRVRCLLAGCARVSLNLMLASSASAENADAPLFLYEPVAIADLGGGESRAAAINNLDWIVGESLTGEGATIAFVWIPETGTAPLGTLGGGSSRAFDINDAGVVVGESTDANEITRAFRWTRESGMQPLAHPEDAFFSTALAVNETGQIIGTLDDKRGSHTVLWQDGELIFLQRMPGAGHVQPLSVNRRGDVVGQVGVGLEDDPSVSLAFYFPRAVAARSLSEFRLVTALSGSSAVAINEEGVAAGYIMTESSRVRAFRYHPQRGLEMLDDRGALFSSAADINEQGWVVGSLIPSYAADEGAYLWRNGRSYDLNEVADRDGGAWWFVQASGVNKRGAMAGYGIVDNEYRAFLLRPVASADPEAWPQPGLRVREQTVDDPAARVAVLEAVIPAGLVIRRVSFYQNDVLLGSTDEAPFEWGWEGSRDEDHVFHIEVVEKNGRITRSPRQMLVPVRATN